MPAIYVRTGYFGQMYSLGMQNGSDPRFLQGIATLKHFDANQLEGDWPGPESVCTGGICTRHSVRPKKHEIVFF